MSAIEEYFNRKQGGLVGELYTSAIAELVTVDLQEMKADIKLLEEEESLIMSVPIGAQQTGGFIIRPPYQVGDKVIVVFAKEDIEPVLYGGGDPSELQHDKDNAIILCGISDYLTTLPAGFAEHERDLIVANKDLTAKFVLMETGEILMDSTENISINSKKDINFTAGGVITTSDSRGGG
ncbi:hypothetical protein ACFQ38_16155 [Sporosarcina contaminans]|uniref:Phage protein Gp138 N-terminal domain-containing protein n=1 Tax=Sporosarcina contaminans TaxID=633403 RepID=A0ABW3U0S6_9BACL